MSDSSAMSAMLVLRQLRAEHNEIEALIGLYAIEPSMEMRTHLASRICRTVRIHYTIEMGAVVPAIAEASGNSDVLERAGVAYAQVMQIINEIAAPRCTGERQQSLVDVLNTLVNEHISASESNEGLLTSAENLPLDWRSIQEQIAVIRADLHKPSWISWGDKDGGGLDR